MEEDKSSIDEPIESSEQTESESTETNEKKSNMIKPSNRVTPKVVIFGVLLALVVFGFQYYDYKEDKKIQDTQNAQAAAQQKKIDDQQKEIDDLKATAAKNSEKASDAPATVPSAALKENIKAAMDSKNYAALEQNMASTVYVVIAASEFAQNRTPMQAVNDLKYFESATSPWDFNLPAATLTAYQTGDYATYFPTTAYVGKATSGQVVSYQFDSSGKIKTIFMSAAGVM